MKMNSLNNLLAHEIVDLYSAEEQIIKALPQMIEKAQNQDLKKALNEHLKVTEQQKKRLEKVHKILQEDGSAEEELGDTTCLGMKGLIEEGKKALEEDMDPNVKDAAIIACAQKIEHYEISGYGTACAFARELGLNEVEKILKQTLNEEYQADDLLTGLAVGKLNDEADEEENISVRKLPASGRRNGRSATAKRPAAKASVADGTKRSASTTRSTTRTKKSAAATGRKKSPASKSKSSGSSRSTGSGSKASGSRSKTRGR